MRSSQSSPPTPTTAARGLPRCRRMIVSLRALVRTREEAPRSARRLSQLDLLACHENAITKLDADGSNRHDSQGIFDIIVHSHLADPEAIACQRIRTHSLSIP